MAGSHTASRTVTAEEALKIVRHQYGSPLEFVSLSRLDSYAFR